jgi:biopolymer transport protein ExbD
MKLFDSINVIPFIDILLVLLAMVLTTATFVRSGQIDITLPAAKMSIQDHALDSRSIVIDAESQFYLDDQLISLVALEQDLMKLSPETPVSLRIDSIVPFDTVVRLIDLLKSLSLNKLSISVRRLQ